MADDETLGDQYLCETWGKIGRAGWKKAGHH